MKNTIIVEGITDKKFLESYINYLGQMFPEKYLVTDSIVENAKGQDAIYEALDAKKGSAKQIVLFKLCWVSFLNPTYLPKKVGARRLG